jgi:hypothetical protein
MMRTVPALILLLLFAMIANTAFAATSTVVLAVDGMT